MAHGNYTNRGDGTGPIVFLVVPCGNAGAVPEPQEADGHS